MLVKSLKLHPYGGKYHAKGSEYEMTKNSDIKLMVAIKAVEVIKEKTEPAKQTFIQPVNMPVKISESTREATEATNILNESYQGHKRGRKRKDQSFYNRKDMRANDSYQG